MSYHKEDLATFKFRPMEPAEENALILRAQRGNKKARSEVALRYQLYIVQQCYRYCGRFMASNYAEDIIGSANVGLMEALRDFSPEKKARFVTLVFLRVRRRILEFVKRSMKFAGEDGSGTLSLCDFSSRGARVEKRNANPDTSPDTGAEIEAGFLDATSIFSQMDPAASAQCADLKFKLRRAIMRLSPREALALRLRFAQESTYAQIGLRLRVSSGSAAGMIETAIGKLRDILDQ